MSYLQDTEIFQNVVDLWTGNICFVDGALQLLLIVDYIFDWARDIYRPAILGELHTLSTGDVITTDSEIFSTVSRRMSSWMDTSEDGQPMRTSFGTISSTANTLELPPFLNITCPEGVIRDAAVLQSRYLALHLNEADIDEFLLSFSTAQEAQAWVNSLPICLSQSWRVTAETIHALETFWTAKFRPPPENQQPNEIFYINIAFNMFMTETWEPVRQLTCFSISERALQRLPSRVENIYGFEWNQNPLIEFSAIEVILGRILKQSILDNITAAVSMLCMTSCFSNRDKRIPLRLLVTGSSGIYAGFQQDRSPFLVTMVTSIYENHKIGQREPRDPYLWLSNLQVKQTIVFRNKAVQLWPDLPPLVLVGRCKGVLIDGIPNGIDAPRRGLFTLQDPVDAEALLETLGAVLKNGPYFKTALVPYCSLHSDHFRHMNLPVKLREDWSTKGIVEVIENWMESLRYQMWQQDDQPGHRHSFPIIIS